MAGHGNGNGHGAKALVAVCVECKKQTSLFRVLMIPGGNGTYEIACRGECYEKARIRLKKPAWRTGEGANVKSFDPAAIARQTQKMREGWLDYQRRRREHPTPKPTWSGDLADIEGLYRFLKRADWTVVMLHLSGWSAKSIAIFLGWASGHTVEKRLKLPQIASVVKAVRAKQFENILNGEFGVKAQARSAAPKVMKRIIEKAGGTDEALAAAKDSDLHRFGETVLKVAGELTDTVQHKHQHVHAVLQGMSKEELVTFMTTRQWPDRLRGTVAKLGLPAPRPEDE